MVGSFGRGATAKQDHSCRQNFRHLCGNHPSCRRTIPDTNSNIVLSSRAFRSWPKIGKWPCSRIWAATLPTRSRANRLTATGCTPGHTTEQADAVQAYIQAELSGTETWAALPPEAWPDSWYRSDGTPKYQRPVVGCCVHCTDILMQAHSGRRTATRLCERSDLH